MVWGVYKEGVGGSCVPSLIGHLASVDVKQHESKGSCVCVCVHKNNGWSDEVSWSPRLWGSCACLVLSPFNRIKKYLTCGELLGWREREEVQASMQTERNRLHMMGKALFWMYKMANNLEDWHRDNSFELMNRNKVFGKVQKVYFFQIHYLILTNWRWYQDLVVAVFLPSSNL